MLSTNDLRRVAAEKAAAVLVLSDKFSLEPKKEDLSNIMRVIALKNYSESTRCIIQLLYYSSKVSAMWVHFRTDSLILMHFKFYNLSGYKSLMNEN